MAWHETPKTFFIFGVLSSIAAYSVFRCIVDSTLEVLGAFTCLLNEKRRKDSRAISSNVLEAISVLGSGSAYAVIQNIDEQPFVRLREEFMVSSKNLKEIVRSIMREMKEGLNPKDSERRSTIEMLPSYFEERPVGDEVGTYYSLDVGGTNFRVCEVSLEGCGRVRTKQNKHIITNEMKRAPGQELFGKFADYVLEFIHDYDLNPKEQRKMGFTFSFPVEQTSLSSGKLIQWNKGITSSGIVGKDVVELMTKAFKKRGINMNITSLVNDTVGTLISHAYTDPQSHISVVLGTGTNAAYYEDISEIKKLKYKSNNMNSKEMIINTEWGGYCDKEVLPITHYDLLVDSNSSNPNMNIFEKLISGMYLGEIVRYVILDLHERGEIFKESLSEEFRIPYKFETAYMSRIERDHSSELLDTKSLLESTFLQLNSTICDRTIIKHVCQLNAIRSARLAAAGIAAIVTKINRLHDCTVAVDGTLFESYPHYANRIRDSLYDILGATSENIILDQAKDGSGRGAAISAALIDKLSKS